MDTEKSLFAKIPSTGSSETYTDVKELAVPASFQPFFEKTLGEPATRISIEWAKEKIDSLYKTDHSLKNAHAVIALALWQTGAASRSAWHIASLDIQNNRIDDDFLPLLALMAIDAELPSMAHDLISQIQPDLATQPLLLDNVLRNFKKQLSYDYTNGFVLLTDIISCNHPTWLMALVTSYAEFGNTWDCIPPIIERIYLLSPLRTDLFARCAWLFFHPRKQYGKAIEWMESEAKADRLSPQWQLNLARSYACANRPADMMHATIERAYAKDSSLTDGYANVAKIFCDRQQWEIAQAFFEYDAETNRLTPASRLKYAEVLAEVFDIEEASRHVDLAYRQKPDLRNGYARIGNVLRNKKNFTLAKDYYDRDASLNKLTPAGKLAYSDILARHGKWNEATILIDDAYHEDASLRDGFIKLLPLIPAQMPVQAILTLFEADHKLNRLSAKTYGCLERTLHSRSVLELEIASAAAWFPPEQLRSQWDSLHHLLWTGDSCNMPVRILNSHLYIHSTRDAITQFREIILQQQYFFDTATGNNPFIIDGGANIGMAIAYFKHLSPGCRIIAFEPNPALYNLCKKNIEHNQWENVDLQQKALTARQGTIAFNVLRHNPMGSGITKRLTTSDESSMISVETCQLSTLINQPVDYLKLDIEAAETEVFMEAAGNIHNIHQGFMEYHYQRDETRNPLGQILSLWEKRGFDYRIVPPPSVQQVSLDQSSPELLRSHWSCSVFFKNNKWNPS